MEIDNYFNVWVYTYEYHLKEMLNIIHNLKNKYVNNINSKDFYSFVYKYSSQYISPYI